VFRSGNIKFVAANEGAEEQLLETMTRGRVYVLVDEDNNQIKRIIYFDNDLKRRKRIDLDHSHRRLMPHVEHDYYNHETDIANGVKREATRPNKDENKMLERVRILWDTYINGR